VIPGIASFVSIGFLLTSFVRTSDAARGVSSLIGFPMAFLSGIFFPVDALPNWLQTVVHILPVYYVSDALHQILNAGGGLPFIDVVAVGLGSGVLRPGGLALSLGVAVRRRRLRGTTRNRGRVQAFRRQ
jgi:ABC-2 type transport system permease protein